MHHLNLSPFSSSPDSAKMEQLSPSQLGSYPQPALTAAPAPAANNKPKSKPRKRVNTAEKRHQHNAVERQRRETLNSKFIVLARLLPALAQHRRPSKSAIVNGSISHLTKQRDQRLLAAGLLRQLCAERDALAKECKEWRAASGFNGDEKLSATAWTGEMDEVCAVEQETFGEFANMGEGDDGEDDPEQDEADMNPVGVGAVMPLGGPVQTGLGFGFQAGGGVGMGIEAATAAVSSFTTSGLITPRMSTDIDPLSLALGLTIPLPGSQGRQSQAQPQTQSQSLGMDWPDAFNFLGATPDASSDPISIHPSSAPPATTIPFNAFMVDSLENLSASPPGSLGLPTPPTSDFSRFTHTPSPRSSGSFVEELSKSQGQSQSQGQDQSNYFLNQAQFPQQQQQPQQPNSQAWAQQQLLYFHSMQQQQLQHSQLAELQSTRSLSSPTNPLFPARSMSTGSGSDGAYFSVSTQSQNIHSQRQSLPVYPPTAFQQIQQMQQQQQQPQQQRGQALAQAQAPRMSQEQLEAWRKIATGGGGARADLGMWAQNALKGF